MKITVIGAGAWGGALAQVLADNQHDVLIWSHSAEEIADINERHQVTALARKKIEHELHHNITGTVDLVAALKDAEFLLFAVPSFVYRQVAKNVNEHLDHPVICISATKGIEPKTHYTMTQILEEAIDEKHRLAVVALSGPTHAEEVIQRKITAIVSASPDLEAAKKVQVLFNNKVYFRVYVNQDRVGVEIGGALKNIIAILSGSATEYDLGDNARAALITRGLFEIVRIGVAMGGNERTFLGLAGLGDLIVTTTSYHSRNFQAGRLLAQGHNVKGLEQELGATAEGIHAVYSAHEIITEKGIYAPLISLLYEVITEQITPAEGIDLLFHREMKDEFDNM